MLKDEYIALRNKLNYDTSHFSMISRALRHPTYKEIISLGRDIIPIILDELDRYIQTDEHEDFPGHWVLNALYELSGERPNDKSARPGVVEDWIQIWIKWGEEKGYLAKDRPKHQKKPPIDYKGWIVVGNKHGEEYVLCPKREPKNALEETIGTGAWVSKVDAVRNIDDGWWKKYAWILSTKEDATIALEILNEKIKNGECSEFNKPERVWIEELK